jgi:hypothetical protein
MMYPAIVRYLSTALACFAPEATRAKHSLLPASGCTAHRSRTSDTINRRVMRSRSGGQRMSQSLRPPLLLPIDTMAAEPPCSCSHGARGGDHCHDRSRYIAAEHGRCTTRQGRSPAALRALLCSTPTLHNDGQAQHETPLPVPHGHASNTWPCRQHMAMPTKKTQRQ